MQTQLFPISLKCQILKTKTKKQEDNPPAHNGGQCMNKILLSLVPKPVSLCLSPHKNDMTV